MTLALVGFALGSVVPLYAWLTSGVLLPMLPLWGLVLVVAIAVISTEHRLQACLLVSVCLLGYVRARDAVLEVSADYSACMAASASGVQAFRARVRDISGVFANSPSLVVSMLPPCVQDTQTRVGSSGDCDIESALSTRQQTDHRSKPGELQLLVYLEDGQELFGDSRDTWILEGDLVEIQGAIAPVEGAKCFGLASQKSIYLPRRTVGIVSGGRLLSVVPEPNGHQVSWLRLKREVSSLRVILAKAVRSRLSETEAGIVMSAVLGLQRTLPKPVDDAIRRTGVAHLLSVSGMHVGLIAAGLVLIVRTLVSDTRKVWLLSVPVLCLYAMLAGMRVSVLRAVLMFGLASVSRAGDLDWSTRRVAEFVALILLFVNPLQLAQVSFQLSFAATYGIIALSSFGPDVRDTGSCSKRSITLAGRIRQSLGSAAMVYVGAQVGVAPLLIFHFRAFSLIGGPATAFAAPLLIGGSVLSLAGIGFESIGLQVASSPCVVLGGWLLKALVSAVLFLGRFAFASVDLSWLWSRALSLIFVSLWGLVLSARRSSLSRRGRIGYSALLCAGTVVCVTLLGVLAANRVLSSRLELYFLSVGQGDCAVCIAPGGRSVVIDAGPRFEGRGYTYDAGESVLVPFLKWRGIGHVDIFVLTHFHSDHFGGLQALLERNMVSVICTTDPDRLNRVLAREVIEVCSDSVDLPDAGRQRRTHIPVVVTLLAGDSVRIGDDVLFDVIWPESLSGSQTADENAASIVMKLTFGCFDALLTGDIGAEQEVAILRGRGLSWSTGVGSDERDSADASYGLEVLKVPHHGSQHSSSSVFLKSVSPWLSVASVGTNRHGHPSPEVQMRLSFYSQMVLRTDEDRSIRVWTDGTGFSAATSNGRVLFRNVALR